MSVDDQIDAMKGATALVDRGLPPRATDFLGREIRVDDNIVYPVSTQSAAHMVQGVVLEVRQGINRWKRPCAQIRVRSTKDSRNMLHSPSRRPIWLTNVNRCVIVTPCVRVSGAS